MTTEEIIAYYADLLILQYRKLTKARATIETIVAPVVMDQLPFDVRDAFNLETAVGAQLDILGKYAGVRRSALSFSGLIILDDDDFRQLIKMQLLRMNSESTLEAIDNLIATFFPDSLAVFDYGNMSMSYTYNSNLGSEELAEVFVRQNMLPKPMGVQLASLIFAATLDNIFSFRTYSAPSGGSGFNTYTTYEEDRPWISYDDALSI